MALYAYGCVSGLLVDAGASGTRVCPVYEGYCLPHAARSSPVGGDAVIGYLKHLEEGAGAGTKTEETNGEEEDELKRRGCYVAQDYEMELHHHHHHHHHQGSEVTEYRLPDGSTVAVGDQRFRSGELLFRPALHGYSDPGAHILALSSLQACNGNDLHNHLDNHILNDLGNDLLSDLQSAPECSLQRLLLGNVCVCGGMSLLPGFPERLQGELVRLVPQGSAVQLLSARGRHCSAWLGGAVASCLSSFKPLWITSAQYREEGSSAVLTRCY
ncbi:actin, muscle-like [Engraulis encrasicolus]|uniref:actin, muscle-like n=1 Tax=Engraulis encrasicolus TaxID=184585 RepID=UPI002FD0D47E